MIGETDVRVGDLIKNKPGLWGPT